MKVTFLGTGDAFAGGGRMQTCILLEDGGGRVLVDCGASSMIALRRHGVPFNSIDAILLTHLHGDHYSGVPFLLLDAHLASRRDRPLTVAGPPGTRARLEHLGEALFPGMSGNEPRYPLDIIEMRLEEPNPLPGMVVTPFAVAHSAGGPATGLRVERGGKVLTYSGDTAWTDALIAGAAGADLFIVECYYFEKEVPRHMNYRTLSTRLGDLDAARIILTHMGEDMLTHVDAIPEECAYDGLTVEI